MPRSPFMDLLSDIDKDTQRQLRRPLVNDAEDVTLNVTVELPINATREQIDDAWDDFLGVLVDEFNALKDRS